MKRVSGFLVASAATGLFSTAGLAQGLDLPEPGPDDLMFSLENMDLTADPATDFYRFAAGGWLDRVERPAHLGSYSFAAIQSDRIQRQVAGVLDRAVAEAPDAAKGSPTQLVGDFYRAYMDVEARDARSMAPLKGELDRIAAISSLDDLTRYSARYAAMTGKLMLFGVFPSADLVDGTRYVFWSGPGDAGLEAERDVYAAPETAPRRIAYRAYVNDLLVVAGYEADVAARMADVVLDIETKIDATKLAEAEKVDTRKLYNPMSQAEFQALIPNVDMALFAELLGFELSDPVVVTEPDHLRALSQMLEERPIEDWQDYAAFLLIDHFAEVLQTGFDEPIRAKNEAFTGESMLRPREERAFELLKQKLGHPISQLYVDATFSEETRTSVLALIDRVMAAFRERIPTRDWLSEETRENAIAKLDAFRNGVGYPEDWIDYSGVEISPETPVANLVAINEFGLQRMRSRFGGPVVVDDFNDKSTLPVVMNAANILPVNGFRITAAIAQPPVYQPGGIPAVRFCGFGGVIGHEATHGFDSRGRFFDADGNLKSWWTEADAEAFTREAQKLVDQTDAFEIVPGHTGNGALWVTENLADVGGITLGHAALMTYLAEHPEEDVAVGGFSQEQMCFVAWAQLWAQKASDAHLINVASSSDHPPNIYRATAALQHVEAFYSAFGIEEGDPMWLAPERRVNAW